MSQTPTHTHNHTHTHTHNHTHTHTHAYVRALTLAHARTHARAQVPNVRCAVDAAGGGGVALRARRRDTRVRAGDELCLTYGLLTPNAR